MKKKNDKNWLKYHRCFFLFCSVSDNRGFYGSSSCCMGQPKSVRQGNVWHLLLPTALKPVGLWNSNIATSQGASHTQNVKWATLTLGDLSKYTYAILFTVRSTNTTSTCYRGWEQHLVRCHHARQTAAANVAPVVRRAEQIRWEVPSSRDAESPPWRRSDVILVLCARKHIWTAVVCGAMSTQNHSG